MAKYISTKAGKSVVMLMVCQLMILGLALGSYLINRGQAFFRAFSCDEFTLSGGIPGNDSVRIDPQTGAAGTFINIVQPLEKGNYLVQINYATSGEGSTLSARSGQVNELELRAAPAELNSLAQSASLTVDLSRDASDLTIEVFYSGSGTLVVTGIGIYETSNVYKKNMVYAAGLCVLLAFLYYFTRCEMAKRKNIFILSMIYLFSCYPLFMDYMLAGHDLPFHLLRIEGIYHGLTQGVFPVKIHPVWAQDYGYAVGVFYGDAFLYFPAFLRCMGFSVQAAYQCFVAAMNLGTVIIAYFCFGRMFQSSKIGLWGALLYSLSMYRLQDVYTRAACGEFTALMVMPMVLCGFYLIFTESVEVLKKNWWKYSFLIAFGLTGIIQSHVLSCEMAAVFILLVCLILIKKVFQKHIFLPLVSAAALTVLLNLGFLVPFLDYFDSSIYINSPEWGGHISYSIQNKGLFPVQLLGLLGKANGGSWQASAGVYNEVSYSLGLPLALGIALFLYLLACCAKEKLRAHKNPAAACVCCGLAILALFMSSCYFPWDAMAASGAFFRKMIVSLEFPWRFLAVATVLAVFVVCYAISVLPEHFAENVRYTLCGSLVTLLIVGSCWYYYDFVFTGEPYRVYDTYELSTMVLYSNDYLPTGTDSALIKYGKVTAGESLEILGYQKNGTSIQCRIRTGAASYLELPLNYYRDYICTDTATGTEYPVSAGTNNMIRVDFPAGYEGSVEILFKEPALWRISEILSLVTLLACAFVTIRRTKCLSGLLQALQDMAEPEFTPRSAQDSGRDISA